MNKWMLKANITVTEPLNIFLHMFEGGFFET